LPALEVAAGHLGTGHAEFAVAIINMASCSASLAFYIEECILF
jgi:hypothetical protein